MAANVTRGRGAFGVAVDISLLGDAELSRDLARIESAIQRKIVKKATTRAANVILKSVKQHVPGGNQARRPTARDEGGRFLAGAPKRVSRSALLRKGIVSRAIKRSRRFMGRIIRLPTREELGIPASAKHYWPAAWEFGHKIVRGGKVVGQVPPYSYLRAGFDAVEGKATEVMRREVRQGIDTEARKR